MGEGIIVIGLASAVACMMYAIWCESGAVPHSPFLLIIGILGLIVGITSLLYLCVPAMTNTLFTSLLILIFGFVNIGLAIFRRPGNRDRRFLIGLTGSLSVILGGVFVASMFDGERFVTTYLGCISVVYGALSILTGLEIRRERQQISSAFKLKS